MWKFKPFASKEQNGIEGRIIDIGNFKVQVRNVIAEGGFSSVYSARDAIHGSKQYALKHIICNDEESLELVMKEISVMKSLKGHPNVVTLYAHNIFDMGRTKEALLLMEYCEKSLVNVLENRGAGFFEEKQILLIFRDVCDAVFAMHCQTPPIAHRDLKAENLLLGSDGLWKLCDFGSTTTNHKRFEKPEEMGIEEDNIRKHTTPAYRSPEMWDLFRKEVINEKVDIWALGCLLFRICYFKLAFDGESKLQVLNGNYRIPDLPKYSKSITDLIKDMLQSSPNDRPDITQVWFRVNGLLPEGLQKSLPDRPPEMEQHSPDVLGGMAKPSNKSIPMPRRSPPPPPSTEAPQNISPSSNNRNTGGSTGPLGAFWTTQHAKDSLVPEEKARPKYDEELTSHERHPASYITPQKADLQKNSNFQNDGFNAFAADFSANKLSPGSDSQRSSKEETLKTEVEMLKEQLSHVNMEKAEITSKYEKLSAICRSQRQEIQELRQALAAKTPSPTGDATRNLAAPGSQSSTSTKEKIEGSVLELQQGFFDQRTPSPDSQQQWQAFSDIPKQETTPTDNTPKSVRTRKDKSGSSNTWGFEADNFKAVPVASSQVNISVGELNSSKRFGESKNKDSKFASQPSGWAGF